MKTNKQLQQLIAYLKSESAKQKVNLWRLVAKNLEKSTRSKRVVNLGRLNITTKENEVVVVPGKVLGSGELNHSLTIAALSFSKSAKDTIEKSKGKCLTLNELMKQNPKKVRIIG